MYYINKIIGWVFSPMGILFAGLIAGAICARLKRKRLGWCCGMASTAAFWILGCGVATRLIGVPLESSEVELTIPANSADAIVLLGGGMGTHRECGRAEMFGSADRVWTASTLFKGAVAPKVVLSGGGAEKSTIPLLEDMGVPRSVVKCFEDARNTEEEARCISADGITNIVLVTSAWHMPRAKMLFERKGFVVIPAPTDYEMHYIAEMPLSFADFIPSADALSRNSYAVKEWIARLGYAVVRH